MQYRGSQHPADKLSRTSLFWGTIGDPSSLLINCPALYYFEAMFCFLNGKTIRLISLKVHYIYMKKICKKIQFHLLLQYSKGYYYSINRFCILCLITLFLIIKNNKALTSISNDFKGPSREFFEALEKQQFQVCKSAAFLIFFLLSFS